MKTKRLTQRILSAVFSLATLLSLSTLSFASSGFEGRDPNGNGQSTGNNGYGTNDTYETGFALNDQGYRMSLVKNDGTVHNNSVVDLEIARDSNWRLTDTVNAQIGHSTATDPNSAGQRIDDPILIDKNVPKAITDGGGTFVGNGEAVKAWMMEKDSNDKARVLALVEKSFPDIDDETKSKIISGEIKVELEPLLQMPIYNGNQFTGERVLATPRDYLAMLRERYPADEGYSEYVRMGGYMKPVLKAALQSMFLQNDDLGLKAMSKEEMDKLIEDFILNGDLNQLGAGLFIFDLGDKTPPPQQPTQPQTSTGTIDITESRITRHKKLSDVDTTLIKKEFEWEVPAFANKACHISTCHTHIKTITDPSNTLYIDEMNKPGQNEGVVKENLWTAIDDSTNKKDYTRSIWDNDTITLSGVGIIFTTSKNTGHSIVNTNFGGVKGKISLQSNQWSTHAEAVKKAGSNCVLPGGAVLDLAILKDDRQKFTVESIKPILAGSGFNQVKATTNRYNRVAMCLLAAAPFPQ